MVKAESFVEPLSILFRRVAIVARTQVPPSRPNRTVRAVEPLVLGSFLLALAVAILCSTATRLYWFDEIFTLHLARAPLSLAANLANGADQNPPLGYLLTTLCTTVFGEVEWAVRLPALAGALMGSLGLYLFVRHRRGPWEAFLAMAVVTSSAPVWVYFLEARPYGLAIGFTAVSLVFWQRRWPIAFGTAIVLGLLSHYFFSVSILAFALAELVRSIQNRQLDRRFAFGFLASGIALAAMHPFWGNTSKQYSAHFWSKPKLTAAAVEEAFAELARKELAIPFALALVAGIAFARRAEDSESYPLPEAIAIAALAAGPAIGVLVGTKIVGMYHFRYSLPAILGLAAAFAFATARMSGGHRGVLALATAAFVAFGLVGSQRMAVGHYRAEAEFLHGTAAFLNESADGRVLVESPFEFVRIWHYHPELPVAFVCDVDLARKHTKADTVDRGLRSLEKIADVPIMNPDEVAKRLKAGEAMNYFGPCTGWHRGELEKRGIAFTPIATRYNGTLYNLTILK